MFRPLYIYDLSFLLSFASMFSIICLYAPFVKLFKKIFKFKKGDYIAQLCATTLSANIGVYPLIAHFFNTFSVYSFIANLILLPLINIAFVVFRRLLDSTYYSFFGFFDSARGMAAGFNKRHNALFKRVALRRSYCFFLGRLGGRLFYMHFYLGRIYQYIQKTQNGCFAYLVGHFCCFSNRR